MAKRARLRAAAGVALAVLVWAAGPARAEEPLAELRARIGRLDSQISGLALVANRVEGRPGEAWVLWPLAQLHAQRAEAHLHLHARLNPPPGALDDLGLVPGVPPPAETLADRQAYEALCERLRTRFAGTSPGAEASLDLGITREADFRMDEAGALFAEALARAREPHQIERARFFSARWLVFQAAWGRAPDGHARALELLRPVAAGTRRLLARDPHASEPLDVRREALRLTGECLGRTGRPEQLRAALAGGGLAAAARVRLLEDLAHSYVCWRQLPFSAEAYRILLAEQPAHAAAPRWRTNLLEVEAEIAAGRTGGCRYDFSGSARAVEPRGRAGQRAGGGEAAAKRRLASPQFTRCQKAAT